MSNATATVDPSAPFPLDWNAWRPLWDAWLASQLERGTLRRSPYRFPPANFLADEVLGVYSTESGPPVELSEVTFPDLAASREAGAKRMARYVGVTFGRWAGTESGGVASTFGELEHALGLD